MIMFRKLESQDVQGKPCFHTNPYPLLRLAVHAFNLSRSLRLHSEFQFIQGYIVICALKSN